MKKCINGRVVEMADHEVEAMRQALLSQVWEATAEERLKKLEQALEKLETLLQKLFGSYGG